MRVGCGMETLLKLDKSGLRPTVCFRHQFTSDNLAGHNVRLAPFRQMKKFDREHFSVPPRSNPFVCLALAA